MSTFRTVISDRESTCVNCGEQIEPGTPKIIFEGWFRGMPVYKTSHISPCIRGDADIEMVES